MALAPAHAGAGPPCALAARACVPHFLHRRFGECADARSVQGAAYAYGTIVAPLLQRHEAEVDRHLAEASARVGDVASSYYSRAATHLQARFAQLLQSLPQQPQA